MDKFIVRTKKVTENEVPSTSRTLERNLQAMLETSSESDGTLDSEPEEFENKKSAVSAKRQKICRKYDTEWELQYKWLQKDIETNRSYCISCKQLLLNQKNHLDRHQKTQKHIANTKQMSENSKIQLNDFLPKRTTQFRQNVAIAEIKLVLRMLKANHSFKSMDNIAKFNANIYPDSNIAKAVTCGRTKSKEITQFLGKEGHLAMVLKMQKQKFSLIIDETTDISTQKCLVIVVRQFDKNKGKTADNFFRLVQPNDGFSQTICNAVLEELNNENIPLKNFIGFATDNASTMVGKKTGVSTLLKGRIPHLFHIGCVCHSVNLMNNSALACLPDDVEELPKNIFNFFKSAKRQMDFKELQSIFDVPEHKLLRLCGTRWLSFESVAKRILEQWTVLQHFFIRAQFEEKCKTILQKIEAILNGLSAKNKIYLKFLVYILNIMNNLNKKFQSESSQIIYVISSTREILLQILKNFIKKEYLTLTDLGSMEYKNMINVKDVINIYIGHEAEEVIRTEGISEVESIDIKGNILNFYQRLCDEILNRIDINNKRLIALRYLDPKFIQSTEDVNYHDIVAEYSDVIMKPEAFVNEFKLLECKIIDKCYEYPIDITDVEAFWFQIGSLKNCFDDHLYPNLYDFVSYIFTLPHSSACAERVFSKLALMKHKLTNRLQVETCESMLSALNLLDTELEDWTPSKQLVQKYRNEVSKK